MKNIFADNKIIMDMMNKLDEDEKNDIISLFENDNYKYNDEKLDYFEKKILKEELERLEPGYKCNDDDMIFLVLKVVDLIDCIVKTRNRK